MNDVLPGVRHSLVPMVLEESNRGERAFDIYSMLLRQRIVFLGQEVDDQVANLIISQMLYLEALDPDSDIRLYINSPGGLAYGGHGDLRRHPTRPPRRLDDLRRAWGCPPPRWCSAAAPRASDSRCRAPAS